MQMSNDGEIAELQAEANSTAAPSAAPQEQQAHAVQEPTRDPDVANGVELTRENARDLAHDDCSEPDAGAVEVNNSAPESAPAAERGEARSKLPSHSLLGPAPVVAGEDPEEFEQIFAQLEADYPDTGESDVLRRWQIENAAVKIFAVRRGTRAQRGVWNAAFADALLRRMTDQAAVEVLKLEQHAGVRQSDEPIESTFRQGWFRWAKKTCVAAVAGDPTALEQVEEKLGSDALEIDSAVDFDALYAVLASIDRVVRPAQTDGDAAFRSLEKLKKRAEKKRKTEQTTAPPTGRVRNVGTSKRSRAPEQPKTTPNPPTVIVPKPTGDDDGGAR
jgi:hypothetical protein